MPTNGGMSIQKAAVMFDRVINARDTSKRIMNVVGSINGKLFGSSPACDEQCNSPDPCVEYVVDETNANLELIEKALINISDRL
ncbi:hypothetical protein [Phosphitispora fastidiosa]|uniref:hypothetical protein n=1 Tax=Phosphitispora fastidiosa TaxID=2837202 RepID=UPI001E4CFF06|nr:hypothetical protein [Phosphitispora fastidiosa]MBU7006315.1 hypothetical protein [Phosphitispora fastidiosa]